MQREKHAVRRLPESNTAALVTLSTNQVANTSDSKYPAAAKSFVSRQISAIHHLVHEDSPGFCTSGGRPLDRIFWSRMIDPSIVAGRNGLRSVLR